MNYMRNAFHRAVSRVQDTSKDALAANSGKLETMGDRIVSFLRDKATTFTRAELAQALDISTSTMSGRIRNLLDEGRIIEEPGRFKCKVTGNMVRGVSAA